MRGNMLRLGMLSGLRVALLAVRPISLLVSAVSVPGILLREGLLRWLSPGILRSRLLGRELLRRILLRGLLLRRMLLGRILLGRAVLLVAARSPVRRMLLATGIASRLFGFVTVVAHRLCFLQ